ncbi:hypothetical protein M885DRAFT_570444 [Pelagophyceae sp. CCMP2097]|nr:hypothetical protein M885DRAFT_570444 [Pelagophyceae sp. CCMP2097]
MWPAVAALGAACLWLHRACGHHVVVSNGVRFLLRGRSLIGAAFVEAPEAAAFRGWAVQRAALQLVKIAGRRSPTALVVGLGGGAVLNHLVRGGYDAHAVELSQDVIDLAVKHFGVDASRVKRGDGLRAFKLRDNNREYDVVVIDVVDPESLDAAWRFLKRSALVDVKTLGKDALLVFNGLDLWAEDDSDFEWARAAASRLGRRWRHVRAFRDSPPADEGATNIVLFASDAPIDVEALGTAFGETPPEPNSEAWVVANFVRWEVARCDDETCRLVWPGDSAPWRAHFARRPGRAYEAKIASSLEKVTEAFLPAAARRCKTPSWPYR